MTFSSGAAAHERITLGDRLVRWIFSTLINSEEVHLVTAGSSPQKEGLIQLELPSLLRTIAILLKPDLRLGQYYVDGYWSAQPERLFDFLYLLRSQESSKLQGWFLLSNRFHLVRDALKQRVMPIRSTRAVVEHYNTDPIFMEMMLGPSLSYTCAFFNHPDASLDEAQAEKLDVVARRASIDRDHSVLDLGTGWGYAPFPLAEKIGCHVTGITLSNAQVQYCNQRRELSVARNRLRFVCTDYATYLPTSTFDRVISMGMLEHVGKHQYKFFFDKIAKFLNPEGVALIHSMIDERETSPDSWIDKNIFPGGYIPTASEVLAAIEKSDCQLISLFTQEKSNYFRTLELWKRNLFEHREQCESRLAAIGLRETEIKKIIRIWEYFLSSSQIAFSYKYGRCRVAHFVIRPKSP
jgi:cyclopropane-fatty-acyl-phospholipid synthase